ncbi:MAG: T9SS type A sorting domain-containing protein, partial [Candidatus Eisenbacteria bacterium]|nr:T9SS type A sorting domain-containing protein [Candidatus Eisenbacteria bacterium]
FIASMEGGARPTGCRIRFTLDVSPDQAYYSGGVVYMGGNYGYDDTILLHEFGHFVQYAYGGFSDNPGGGHYVDDSAQDPRLSFGEGWPTFFSCGTRDWAGYLHPQVYMNSTGDSTTGVISFSYDVETYGGGESASCEVSITACLWDQVDGDMTGDNTPGVDDEPGYQMDRTFQESWDFTRDYLSQPPFSGTLTYEDYHDLWIASVASPQTAELLQIEQLNHGIQYVDDAYEDDDSHASPGTYYGFVEIGRGLRTHHTTWPAGDEDWMMFEGLAGCTYQAETSIMRDGADTYIEFQNSAGTVLIAHDNVAAPSPGSFNTFENLRSLVSYTTATTQNLYVRVRRSPNSPWGGISKYGNWDIVLRITSVPATYPNITASPGTFFVTLDQNTTLNRDLTIGNTGTQDTLIWDMNEGSEPIPWVTESLTSGSIPPSGSQVSVITFDATGLNVGTYRDTLHIPCNDPNSPIRLVTLIMTVEQAPQAVGDDLTQRVDLEPNIPNPFEGETSIRFALDKPAPATLSIFDVQGREVRRLTTGGREAGVHTVAWDGRDDAGRPLPSGVYLYSLTTPERTLTRKLVMTR